MQKENPFWNSVRQIKVRCAKYKFAERSHNFLMQYLCSSSLVTFEILTTYRFVPKENPFWNSVPCERKSKKCRKLKQSKQAPKPGLTEPPFEAYMISSTSMQKENPVANSVRQIKIWCAKYKGPLLNSMKIRPRGGGVEKYLIFSTLLAATKIISK